jgi:hypothetical protein
LLFNLANDPAETFNLAKDQAGVIAEIQHIVQQHRAGLVPGTPEY